MLILFDGTPARPLGRMLFAEEGVTVAPVPPEPRRIRERVRAVKWEGFLGSADIGTLAGITTEQANSCVSNLVKLGEIEREHRYMTARKAGGQRYRFTR